MSHYEYDYETAEGSKSDSGYYYEYYNYYYHESAISSYKSSDNSEIYNETANGDNGFSLDHYHGNNSYHDNETNNNYASKSGYLVAGKIIPPFFILLGTLGSVLIILVFTRSTVFKNRKSTTKIFMCALAVSDLLGLYVGLFPRWLLRVGAFSHPLTMATGTFINIVLPWVTASVMDYSSWLIVAVTIERVLATCQVVNIKNICTQRFAKAYIVACGVTLLVINSHVLYGLECNDIGNGHVDCWYSSISYQKFYYYNWSWISVTIYCLIPYAVICVGNCVILFQLRRSHLRLRNNSTTTGERTGPKRLESLSRGRAKSWTLRGTILLINTAFLISTFPNVVLVIMVNTTDENEHSKYYTFGEIANDCSFLNNTFNICLYCLSAGRFRKGLMELMTKFSKSKKRNVSVTSFRSRHLDTTTDMQDRKGSSTGFTTNITLTDKMDMVGDSAIKMTDKGTCETVL